MDFFKPISYGPNNLKISHLQFADDTIFLGKPTLKNAVFLKRFLLLVEEMSGLRINKDKCQVIPIKADPGLVEDIVDVLRCKKEARPFKYLGVNVGSRHKKAKDWKYVIDKVSNRLSKWSKLKISLGGRITLIKSVLSALPTYVLSVFRAPLKVIKKLISLQQRFLWGGGVCDRKIIWAKWDSLSIPKSLGGLGLRDLVCCNKALMSKWGWRALEGGDALWLDIVKGSLGRSGAGKGGLDLFKIGHRVKGWWGDVLACIRDHKGAWFDKHVVRCVGNGLNTSFWDDPWVGETALKQTFPRLYELCCDKSCSVASAGEWVDDRWEWRVGWRRILRGWEADSMNSLIDLLKCRKAITDEPDKWWWQCESSGLFSVRSSYALLLDRKLELEKGSIKICKLLWWNLAAAKVQATAWRIIFRRIATRGELRRRGVIPLNIGSACPLCDGPEESIEHLFVECGRTWELWSGCLEWLSFKVALPNKVQEHFAQFSSLAIRKKERQVLSTIWVCTSWMIWKQRNEIVFNSGTWKTDRMLGEIKSLVWSWVAVKKPESNNDLRFRSWSSSPLLGLQ